jgi:anti-sigma B factor antagonist
MRTAIREAVNAGNKKILLNLAEVSYLDSAGLGEMASAYITVTNMGGKLKLLHTQERVNSMLHVTKLYTLLVAYTDESVALASFA